MAAGRPTGYSEEVLEASKQYLAEYNAEDNEEATLIPTVAGLALHLKVARSTVYEWSNADNQEFSDILSDLMAKQEVKLINGGLGQSYNSTITKLMLTKHGYTDKQETDNLHSFDFSNLSDKELKDIVGS